MVGTTAQDATPLDDTADPLGTIQLNLPSNQSPEIRRSIGVEVEKRHAIYVPSEPDLPALARSLQQALEDYVPADSAGLPVRKGDLIQCFGETDGLESYFGRIYPGGPLEYILETLSATSIPLIQRSMIRWLRLMISKNKVTRSMSWMLMDDW
jgi:hypothetical protein